MTATGLVYLWLSTITTLFGWHGTTMESFPNLPASRDAAQLTLPIRAGLPRIPARNPLFLNAQPAEEVEPPEIPDEEEDGDPGDAMSRQGRSTRTTLLARVTTSIPVPWIIVAESSRAHDSADARNGPTEFLRSCRLLF